VNPLVVDNRAVGAEETVKVGEGACISFSGIADTDPRFLVLRVGLRARGTVEADGQHPAVQLAAHLARRRDDAYGAVVPGQGLAGMKSPLEVAAATAVLECVHAQGAEPQKLPPEARAIAICPDEALEVGRQHQLGFFEHLLKAEPHWLSYISRTHCRVSLCRGAPGQETSLKVENLSANVVLVCGRQLAKGQSDTIAEGGTLGFVAKPSGEVGETQFLCLTLRRARSRVAAAAHGAH